MEPSNKELDHIVVETNSHHCDSSIIWLHGLGADGNDFAGVVEQLNLPPKYAIRFIFPHAPYRAVTINDGMIMRAWYDVYGMTLNDEEDAIGIIGSQRTISAVVAKEIARGTSSNRIILAGFSQGGAIALYTGLRFDSPLGGVIALSTHQVLANTLEQERSNVNQKIPIFMAHGMFDTVIPLAVGKMGYKQLQTLNYKVQWQTYPMQHSVVPEEIRHIGSFIQQALAY